MNLYPKVSKWRVPKDLLSESLAEMRLDGARGDEGICFWLGLREEDAESANISHLVRLRGSGIRKTPAQIQIEPELMREVHEVAREIGKILIGQIHSHGTYFGVKLSSSDVLYGVRIPYYLSVVAPHYAMRVSTQWTQCGIHIYLPSKGYVRTFPKKVILVDSTLPLEVLTASQ